MSNASDFQFDICGIGMSMIDIFQVVEAFPSESGVTEVKETRLMGGGPVPTALCTAGNLGARVAVLDRVGNDWRGRLAKEEYEKFGVNTGFLELEDGKSTTLGCVLVREEDGERHIVFSPGDFTPLKSDELPVELLRSSAILHLNGRHWPACLDAAKIVHESGGLVSFDGGANRYEPRFDELLGRSDIAIVARDFANRLTGSDDNATQLGDLIGRGASIAGITDGPEGSWFATDEGEVFHQAAFTVDPVVDTTGCGDAFHGGFLFAHARGWELRESATFASAVAALNATTLGGRGKLPSLDDVVKLIQGK